jgi:hypothetical protein
MSQEKYIGMDVHQATISVAVIGCWRQADHGVLAGDQGGHDCRVHPRIARNCVADLRGRHVRCLFARGSNSVEFYDKYVRTRLTIVVCA